MTQTLIRTARKLYFGFEDSAQAEKAAGALLDYGVQKIDVSILVTNPGTGRLAESEYVERSAAMGISTTTAEDAGAGAATGAEIGLGVGVLAGLAAIFVPGFGLVYGAGALATALTAVAGTTAAGAVAGAVTGYLKDQGLPEVTVSRFATYYDAGGSLMELFLPSGNVSEQTGRDIVAKYGGTELGAV